MKKAELEALNHMTIIVDSREKVNQHITSYLDKNQDQYCIKKLDFGDYSAKIDFGGTNIDLSDKVVIERKASLDELAINVTKDRERFEREFKRCQDKNAKIFLLIENASWWDIASHHYRSQLNQKSYMATLLAWQYKYNITVSFIQENLSGMYIKGTLYYALRDYLIKSSTPYANLPDDERIRKVREAIECLKQIFPEVFEGGENLGNKEM